MRADAIRWNGLRTSSGRRLRGTCSFNPIVLRRTEEQPAPLLRREEGRTLRSVSEKQWGPRLSTVRLRDLLGAFSNQASLGDITRAGPSGRLVLGQGGLGG